MSTRTPQLRRAGGRSARCSWRYLSAGDPASGRDLGAFEDLGAPKGNKGNQQYAIPDNVDLKKYATVVFWCVPFTQTLAIAQLKPA